MQIHLEFDGCCGNQNCCADVNTDGTLSFGQNYVLDNQADQGPACTICNEAWRQLNYGVVFDIAVFTQAQEVQKKSGCSKIDFTAEDLKELLDATSSLRIFLFPIKGLIKAAVRFFILIDRAGQKMDLLREKQTNRLVAKQVNRLNQNNRSW